jgi:lipopolysaccharide cholinephosphotransferase
LKRIVKAILKKMLSPVLTSNNEVLSKLDKLATSIIGAQSVCNPITECPPAHGTLRKIQLAKANVLFAFDRFCNEKGLRYWLHSGTLLGAVRHKGFIPWDDDIDVAMMRDDFDQFIKIISGMPQNGRIQYYWCVGFLKLQYIENDFVLDAVDIFPFHQYYKRTNAAEGDRLKKRINDAINLNYGIYPLSESPFHGTPPELKIMRETIMEGKSPAEDGDLFKATNYKHIFRHEWVFPLSTMLFEGRNLPVPNNPGSVLESEYGDFMMYPPDMYGVHGSISDQLRDNWRSYEKLDEFLSMDGDALYEFMTEAKK